MRSLCIIEHQIGVERDLHFLDGLEPGLAAFNPEVLVEQRAVQALDDAVGLRTPDAGSLVLDAFELQEQLIGMLVLAAAEFAAIIAQHGLDSGGLCLEAWQHVVVEQLHGGQRQLVGIEASPGVAA